MGILITIFFMLLLLKMLTELFKSNKIEEGGKKKPVFSWWVVFSPLIIYGLIACVIVCGAVALISIAIKVVMWLIVFFGALFGCTIPPAGA